MRFDDMLSCRPAQGEGKLGVVAVNPVELWGVDASFDSTYFDLVYVRPYNMATSATFCR